MQLFLGCLLLLFTFIGPPFYGDGRSQIPSRWTNAGQVAKLFAWWDDRVNIVNGLRDLKELMANISILPHNLRIEPPL